MGDRIATTAAWTAVLIALALFWAVLLRLATDGGTAFLAALATLALIGAALAYEFWRSPSHPQGCRCGGCRE